MKTIHIPDIEGPHEQLCWAQNVPTSENPAPLNPMVRCDRKKGHGGKHTWELTQEIVEWIARFNKYPEIIERAVENERERLTAAPLAPPAAAERRMLDTLLLDCIQITDEGSLICRHCEAGIDICANKPIPHDDGCVVGQIHQLLRPAPPVAANGENT